MPTNILLDGIRQVMPTLCDPLGVIIPIDYHSQGGPPLRLTINSRLAMLRVMAILIRSYQCYLQ